MRSEVLGFYVLVCCFCFVRLVCTASTNDENWEVCTLEGLLSFSEITAYQISPEFTRIREVLSFLKLLFFLTCFSVQRGNGDHATQH